MKNKLLSLLLVITLLAVTVSVALPTTLAENSDNLITNGDFASSTGNTPTGWNVNLNSSAGASAEIVKDVQISDGVIANALKVTTTKASNSFSNFTYGGKIKIEKNATYTMTYWVKVKNIKGFKTYMFEPNYIDLNGAPQSKTNAAEGQNVYTYSYNSGSTRVIRTDVVHSWKIAETGTAIDNSTVSMFISRSNNVTQVLTPDYPETTREGEWLQVVHTFTTGNVAAHEAEVSYDLHFTSAVDGEIWFADFKMSVLKSEVVDHYNPTVNDEILGTVSKDVPLMEGKTAEITAVPFGENTFDGWYLGDQLISTEPTYTFTYDSANPTPTYEARFTKADWGIDGSFETGYTNNQLLAEQSANISYENGKDTSAWNEDLFESTSKDGNNKFFIDSDWSKWGKVSVTNEQAHTGSFSVKHAVPSRSIGYKISGLNKNSDYTVSFYAMTKNSTEDGSTIGNVAVTDANMSCMVKNSSNAIVQRTVEAGALALINVNGTDFRDKWEKVQIDFNSKDSTEVIVWVRTDKAGTVLYLDNYSIKRLPKKFTPAISDSDLGTITPNGITVLAGDEVTVTATPTNDGQFKGWYIGEELMSSDLEYTFIYEDKFSALTAKFEAGVNTVPNYSFEKGYTNDQVLSEQAYKADVEWTEDLFKSSSKDGNNKFFIDSEHKDWGKVTATTAVAHTGEYSIKMSPNSRSVGYKLEGLTKNTDYVLSFYAMTKNTKTDEKNQGNTVGTIAVTDANMSCMTKNAASKVVERTVDAGALGKASGADIDCRDTWAMFTVTFNTKESTDVILWVRPEKEQTQLYIDDLALDFAPEVFAPKANNSSLGGVTPEKPIECKEGDSITVTATPYDSNSSFVGWYVGDELISTEAEYTFEYASKFENLTAVFAGVPGTIPNGGFEYNQNGKLLASYGSEDVPKYNNNAPWSVDTSYRADKALTFTVTNDLSHEGEKSAVLNIPYRYVGMDINGLQPNTAYLVSFWAHITGKEPEPGTDQDKQPKVVSNAFVLKSGDTYFSENDEGTWVGVPADQRLGQFEAAVDCYNKWEQVNVIFTTPADSGDVTLWVSFSGYQAKMYLDDFALRYAPDMFKPAVNNGALGKASPEKSTPCEEGDEVTVTATPYPDSTFKGWYIGEELMSKNAEYTFSYAKKYQGLTAVFEGVPGTIPNPGFEYYDNNQLLASYNDEADPKYNNNPPWSIDTSYRTDKGDTFQVTSDKAHSGTKSGMLNTPYRYVGMDINGLKPGTEYMVSFWAYITGKDPVKEKDDQNPKNVSNAVVVKQNHTYFSENDEGKWVGIPKTEYLGSLDAQVDCYDKWSKVDVIFTTPADSGDVTLWISFSGYQAQLYLDDFSIGFGVKAAVSAELGGTIETSFTSAYVLKGSQVTVSATPFEGNTFAGWFTPTGKEVSKEANYTFTANEDFSLIAKFDGYNKPATDLFSMGNKDGSFENGTVPGWFFYDSQYDSSWCSAAVSSKLVYEGAKSLEISGRYRNSLLALNGLAPNSDYRLSFYINQPDANEKAKVDSIAVIGAEFKGLNDANVIFAQAKMVAANSGWNRIDLYFNSGANISANLAIRYSAETLDGKSDRLFIDNLSLYNYDAANEVKNGSFDEQKANWIGDGAVVAEAGNNVLSLGANESVYQDLAVDAYSTYNVTFKAKGKLTAAAQDLSKFDVNVRNYISSQSYIDVTGTEWKEYTYKVYTGVHQAMNFVFKALENGAMIDDFKVTKNPETVGSVLEHIDFETDRFNLSTDSELNGYSIYIAQNANDPNVYSGKQSLKFTYDKATSDIDKILQDAWLSYQPGIGNGFKISMKIKIAGGNKGGAVSVMPEYSGTYGGDTGFEHMFKTDEWQNINFFVNNTTYGVFKAKIAAIASSTESDFYVDDIVISVTPPMVLEENSKVTYCERLYNAVDNEGFENPTTDKDWGTLPSTAQIVKGDALKGSHFLRANKGTHYVIPVKVEGGKEYYFAASIRGTKDTVANIGISLDKEGNTYYANRNDKPASIINFDSSEKGWKRSGFKITTNNSGIAYVFIDVDAGALDIDSVMMFTADYGYRYDPNDYTVYVPYDFDDLKSPTTVINGGFGEQPYYGVTKEGKEGA